MDKKEYNKAKCKKLKNIRKQIANKIGVDLHQQECTFEGFCTGTCPKCKQEEEILNKALLGRSAAAVGVIAMSTSMVGCSNKFNQISGMIVDNDMEDLTPTKTPNDDIVIDDNIVGLIEYDDTIDDKLDKNNELDEDDLILSGLVEQVDNVDLDELIELQPLAGDVVNVNDFGN